MLSSLSMHAILESWECGTWEEATWLRPLQHACMLYIIIEHFTVGIHRYHVKICLWFVQLFSLGHKPGIEALLCLDNLKVLTSSTTINFLFSCYTFWWVSGSCSKLVLHTKSRPLILNHLACNQKIRY